MLDDSMDADIPDSLKTYLKSIRQFRLEELEPVWEQVEAEGRVPEGVVRRMGELGLFGLGHPKKYGGLELGALGEAMVHEELSMSSGCFRSRIASTNGIGVQGIVMDGTEVQKEKYLPRFASGEWTACFALTEPGAGSDAANISTRAECDGDKWVLNGLKHFITNAIDANVATVIAVTDPEKRSRGGITAFIVERDFPGYSVGEIHDQMGLRASPAAQLVFKDCIVPRENVIGGDEMIGQGFKIAMRILDKARLMWAAHGLGSAQRCLDLSVAYAKERVQFGQPLADFQLIKSMLAEMATDVYAARQMLYSTARLRDRIGTAVIKEASMVKNFCCEAANRVAYKAVQIHGGAGWMKGYQVERFYRDVRLLTVGEGSTEICKLVIARELLRD